MVSERFNPCIVIPVYRHVELLQKYLPQILRYRIAVILVDDGNPTSQQSIFAEFGKDELVTVLRHEKNRGKGAAVTTALFEAQRCGYSHMLQIDADGQHDAKDIEKFLLASQANPEAIILGKPKFDDSAPRARVWGRKLTTLCIAMQTWSFAVGDGLLGYRVYPVKAGTQLLQHHQVQSRMGFDVDVIVRLVWQGVQTINIETQVVYPENGISNFRYFSDNKTLLALHLRLLIGGMLRVVGLNKQSSSDPEAKWFEKQEHGSYFALKILHLLYRIGGRALLEFLLSPVILYFYLKDREGRKYSRMYLMLLRQFSPQNLAPDGITPFAHFKSFGQKILTSLQAWLGEIHGGEIVWHGEQQVLANASQKRGGVVLSAHFGCLDICRAVPRASFGLKITPLMYLKNARIFRNFISQLNPAAELEVLPIEAIHAGTAIAMKQRIEQGEFFALLADREAPNSPSRTIAVRFLGRTARLPEGPFALAVSLECPVFTMFSAFNEKIGKYEVFWDELNVLRPETRSERRQELRRLAQEYARRLEAMCVQAPLQWFNFFDFWAEKES